MGVAIPIKLWYNLFILNFPARAIETNLKEEVKLRISDLFFNAAVTGVSYVSFAAQISAAVMVGCAIGVAIISVSRRSRGLLWAGEISTLDPEANCPKRLARPPNQSGMVLRTVVTTVFGQKVFVTREGQWAGSRDATASPSQDNTTFPFICKPKDNFIETSMYARNTSARYQCSRVAPLVQVSTFY